MDLSPEDAKFLRELQHRMLREAIIEQQTGMSAIDPLRYKRASSPLVDDNSNADKTRPPHWLHFSLAQWCDAAYEENRMNENKIKGWSNCYRHANGSLPLNGDVPRCHMNA